MMREAISITAALAVFKKSRGVLNGMDAFCGYPFQFVQAVFIVRAF